ncbi:SGNH/GDSL hydrolase family protein [Rhizorhabdus histidinilytica]|uniref:Baseplate structural protein Gp9/Gp10 N-terminal domain-containing protein n=1 Tax=Rhizorhabdus histidinilytica TaxID=439228 RepID=A0A1T5BWI0_9SPHN|nr:hypothetical protein [Rhizorhabdus histidinilytica]SKB51363.1 hypothetical protein SAMN06295920_103325 [Rhizorhabdus histidinilytica]
MAKQTINIGAAANDGTGDNLRAAFGKTNSNFDELYAADAALGAQIGQINKPIHLMVEGDSKGQLVAAYNSRSALFWALARNPLDLIFDPAADNLAIGSSTSDGASSTTGLTSGARLATAAARIAAIAAMGHNPVVILKIGTNDLTVTNDNGANSIIANIRKAWASYKAAGAAYLILMTIDPRASLTAGQAAQFIATNRAMRALAQSDRAVFICDTQLGLIDPTSVLYESLGKNTQAPGAVMYDNPALHESAYGAWQMAKPLADVLAKICRPREKSLSIGAGDAYANPSSPTGTAPRAIRGNLLLRQGRFEDTGGVSGQITASGGGGVTGTANWPSAKLFGVYPKLTGTMSGTMAVAISQVPYQPAIDLYGRSDLMATRLTFSGTPTSAGTLAVDASITVSSLPNYDYTVPIMIDADLYFTDVNGLNLRIAGPGANMGGIGVPASNADALVHATGRITPYYPTSIIQSSAPSTLQLQVQFPFFANVPVSGSVDIFGLGIVSNPALPAATP